jgi:spoIIIJ-associated protein
MTESREFYALSVEEAADKASVALGVDRDRLEFEVVDEGSKGFLGIGARDARISVRSAAVERDEAAVEETPDGVELAGVSSTAAAETLGRPEVAPTESEAGSAEGQEAPVELILAADRFATDLMEAMGFDGMVDAYDAEQVIQVNFATGRTGLLIGQKGETIDAVQYLLNLAVYKDRPFLKRIVADTEGYRQRRVEAIQGMAHRTARRAQRERRSLSLPPMSAAERRVVHLYLKDNPGVSTASEGQDEDRRVVISPK